MAGLVHIIDRFGGGERVGCPVAHRDVDLDECQGCPLLRKIDLGAEVPYVVCEQQQPTWLHVSAA